MAARDTAGEIQLEVVKVSDPTNPTVISNCKNHSALNFVRFFREHRVHLPSFN